MSSCHGSIVTAKRCPPSRIYIARIFCSRIDPPSTASQSLEAARAYPSERTIFCIPVCPSNSPPISQYPRKRTYGHIDGLLQAPCGVSAALEYFRILPAAIVDSEGVDLTLRRANIFRPGRSGNFNRKNMVSTHAGFLRLRPFVRMRVTAAMVRHVLHRRQYFVGFRWL